MCAVLPLEGKIVSCVCLKISNQLTRRALIDTGSCANALPESFLLSLTLKS